MQVIYKYPLDITGTQEFTLPEDHTILKVAEQNGSLFLWAQVDTYSENMTGQIVIVGTGHELDMYGYHYLDSVLMDSGLVWHVFYSSGMNLNPA